MDASSLPSPLYSLLRLPAAVQVFSDRQDPPLCTIPILRLQSCCLVSPRFLLYSEVSSSVLKMRELPSGKLVQSLRLPGTIMRLEAAKDVVLAVMRHCSAVVRVHDKLKLLWSEQSCENTAAAGAIRSAGNATLACVVDSVPGSVTLQWLGTKTEKFVVPAHKSPISAVGISTSGRRVVTASEKGTLLRVYDSYSGKLQRELRLSYSCQRISALNFSPDDRFIGVETQDGRETLVECEERRGLFGIVPSFLLPTCKELSKDQCALVQPLCASWLEIE